MYDYLVARALQYEAQGHSVANAFIIHDHKHTGRIAASEAARLVCNILQVPSPLVGDEENTKARDKLLQDVGFKVIICFTICCIYFSIASMLPNSPSVSPFVSSFIHDVYIFYRLKTLRCMIARLCDMLTSFVSTRKN